MVWANFYYFSFSCAILTYLIGDLYLYVFFYVLQYGRYLNVYKKYDDLLDNTAEQNVTAFLKEHHEIEDFVMVGDAP